MPLFRTRHVLHLEIPQTAPGLSAACGWGDPDLNPTLKGQLSEVTALVQSTLKKGFFSNLYPSYDLACESPLSLPC